MANKVWIVERYNERENEYELVAICDTKETAELAALDDRKGYIGIGITSEDDFDEYYKHHIGWRDLYTAADFTK